MITHQQTAGIEDMCISETRRLASAILEITDNSNLKDHSVTIDMEKDLASLRDFSLVTVLKTFGFGSNFLE